MYYSKRHDFDNENFLIMLSKGETLRILIEKLDSISDEVRNACIDILASLTTVEDASMVFDAMLFHGILLKYSNLLQDDCFKKSEIFWALSNLASTNEYLREAITTNDDLMNSVLDYTIKER